MDRLSYIEKLTVQYTTKQLVYIKKLYLKEDQNFLLHPRKVIEQAIKMLHRRERDRLLKDALKDLLEIVGAQ